MICYEEIADSFDDAKNINVYDDGQVQKFLKGESGFETVLCSWKNLLQGSHQMPAYGVSLDRETRKELSRGLWAEFEFDALSECNGLPFEKLLVSVAPDYYGFNIVRFNSKAGYDGRCFYIDLVNKNMSEFYKDLKNAL